MTTKMALSSITSGKIMAPIKTLVYGPEGVGKSTFASESASPVFIPVEEGTNALDVKRFPRPETLQDFLDAIIELGKGEHEFKTVVVDTIDALEPLIWAAVCKKGKKDSIEDFGYGKGYTIALAEWLTVLHYLERLRALKGINVVLLAHSQVKTFKNPEGEDFDRYELKLAGKGASALCKEWSDNVLLATYEVIAATNEQTKRTRGLSTGNRIAHTVHSGAYDAKNRHSLPDPMPFVWADYRAAVAAHFKTAEKPAEKAEG